MQKIHRVIDEVIPHHSEVSINSVGEMLQRQGRRWNAFVNVTANNETKITNVFKINGTVLVLDQKATITAISDLTNCTNVYATFYDSTASIDLTADGITLSGVPVGTTFFKDKVAAQPYTVLDASAGSVYEPTDWKAGKPFYVQQKAGADSSSAFT